MTPDSISGAFDVGLGRGSGPANAAPELCTEGHKASPNVSSCGVYLHLPRLPNANVDTEVTHDSRPGAFDIGLGRGSGPTTAAPERRIECSLITASYFAPTAVATRRQDHTVSLSLNMFP